MTCNRYLGAIYDLMHEPPLEHPDGMKVIEMMQLPRFDCQMYVPWTSPLGDDKYEASATDVEGLLYPCCAIPLIDATTAALQCADLVTEALLGDTQRLCEQGASSSSSGTGGMPVAANKPPLLSSTRNPYRHATPISTVIQVLWFVLHRSIP